MSCACAPRGCATRWAGASGSTRCTAPGRLTAREIHRRARRPEQLSGAWHVRALRAGRAARPHPRRGQDRRAGDDRRAGALPCLPTTSPSSAPAPRTSGRARCRRIYDLALKDGMPLVHFGEDRRRPDPGHHGRRGVLADGTTGLYRPAPSPGADGERESSANRSRLPRSLSAASRSDRPDRGTCLAITSPRVLEGAIGEQVSLEELGGTAVHDRITGQVDLIARDGEHAVELVRRFLSYLPPNAWTRPPRHPLGEPGPGEPEALVPVDRRRAWDMRR